MSDIIERLTAEDILTSIITSVWCKVGRHPGELADLMKEAADEITRLRAENETLRRDVKTAVMGDSAELADVKRDNETLRGLLREAHVKMVENDLWVNLRQRVTAAIRESGE